MSHICPDCRRPPRGDREQRDPARHCPRRTIAVLGSPGQWQGIVDCLRLGLTAERARTRHLDELLRRAVLALRNVDSALMEVTDLVCPDEAAEVSGG